MASVLRVPIRELRYAAAAVVLAGVVAASCVRSSREVPNSPAPMSAAPAPFLAVRLAFKDAAAGRERARYGDTTVFLAPEVLLSDDDLLSVRPVMRADGLLLRVHYRLAAAQRLSTATGSHLGDHLAVLLDSRVWSLAQIASAIGNGDSLTIATSATGEDGERLAERIRSRWPPR